MKQFCLLLLFCWSIPSLAQKILQGRVVDESGIPVSGASVFLANTTYGTVSDSKGSFSLTISNGKYQLVVSSIGFETNSAELNTATVPEEITIRLKPKVKELENVTVTPFEKDGWEKWGKFFIENFIGTSAEAKECSIKNYKSIKFRFSKNDNELTAIALESLIIENKALGYIIQYQLELFAYKFKLNYLSFEGYPLFKEMEGSERKKRKWEEKRAEVFEGSMIHFMRSIYRNKLEEEGFEVRHLIKVHNAEKERMKKVYTTSMKREIRNGVTYIENTLPQDSIDYYHKLMSQPDNYDVINNTILKGDSIAYAVDSITAGMDFKNYLYVLYKNKKAPEEYWSTNKDRGSSMVSQLVLVQGEPIEIQANGYYRNPLSLMSLGYWSWSEKIGNMLPFNYETQKKK